MTRISSRMAIVAAVSVSASLGLLTSDASAQAMAPHRAVYDIALADASDRSGITGMNGRIVYEFQGSVCDGYTTNFRFVTRIRSQAGDRLTDQQTSTYEDAAGELFRFVTKSFVDEKLDRELSGTAERTDDTISVELKKPEPAEFTLGPGLFPTAHIIDLIERANAGERIYESRIFDGSEDADRIMTTTVIAGPKTSGTDGDGANAGPLKDVEFRNVSISYFDEQSENGGEALPDYQISFKLYDNGVTRDLLMDYGDFALTGMLQEIEMLPQESCD